MKVQELKECSLNSWYSQFEDVTYKSVILPMPIEVVSYFQDNGPLVLPSECECYQNELEAEDRTSASNNELQAPCFSTFTNQISDGIKNLGGTIFPKLNWSSPKDAVWISHNRTLQCSYPVDAYLLLKSSDFVSHDLTCPFEDCDDYNAETSASYYLVLRQWTEVNPIDEFRCFVKQNRFIGICQRDPSQIFGNLQKEEQSIVDDIIDFWEEHIKGKFALDSYVFDVHRPDNQKVILVDFGPFSSRTDCLLFTWDELDSWKLKQNENGAITNGDCSAEPKDLIEVDDPEFRCVLDNHGVQPSPYSQYGYPLEVMEMAVCPDNIDEVKLIQQHITEQQEESSSDED